MTSLNTPFIPGQTTSPGQSSRTIERNQHQFSGLQFAVVYSDNVLTETIVQPTTLESLVAFYPTSSGPAATVILPRAGIWWMTTGLIVTDNPEAWIWVFTPVSDGYQEYTFGYSEDIPNNFPPNGEIIIVSDTPTLNLSTDATTSENNVSFTTFNSSEGSTTLYAQFLYLGPTFSQESLYPS